MERMCALSHDWKQVNTVQLVLPRWVHTDRTVVSWELAFRTGAIKLYATDTAIIVFGHVPPPGGDSMI